MISGRELGTGERWFRGLLAPLDIVPGLGAAKKFVTTGKVTSKVADFSKIGLKSADLAKVRQSIGNTVQTAKTTGLNRIKQVKQISVDKIKQDVDQFKQIGSSAMNKIDEGAANFVNLLRGEEMAVAGIGSIGKIDSGVMNTAKNVDSGVMFSKSTGNVASKGGGIEYKNYKAVEYTGTTKVSGEVRDTSRRVYQRIDIDFGRVDPKTGKTNYQLIKSGRPPIWKDGTKIELHHLIQKEPGSMVELPSSMHKEYDRILHGLVENGGSFRNDPVLKKQYENFRSKYWRWRAKQIDKGEL